MPACLKSSLLATLVGLALLTSCRLSQKSVEKENAINQIVAAKLGAGFESHQSPSNAYFLFIEKINPTAANPQIKFIVIESVSQKIILEKSFKPGYVKWIGDSVIELLDTPTLVKQNEDLSSYVKKIDIAQTKN